ncbi:MAG: HlyC/CorC family transporter [candidate division Zixibacteria bacterium]|nr:HlyC/CorC family transporter [candidate division Zixibacteria bacterium]
METKDNSEPPSSGYHQNGFWTRLKRLFKKEPAAKLSQSQKDAFIEKSIEEFSTNISMEAEKLEQAAKKMIHGIIDLSDTAVKEIMVPRVDIVGIEEGASLAEIIELVKKTGHSRFPFYRESLDEIKGILYIKDVFVDYPSSNDTTLDTITRPAYFVPENKKASELLKEMKMNKIHLSIVVDEYGGTAGLVTLEDALEEIVGEIEDEYDLEEQVVKKIDETHYSVKGSLPISDLNEELDLDLPEDQFETVGGVIYDIVGRLPEQGTTIDYQSLKFTAEVIDGQRITRVIVELVQNKITNKQNTNSE